MSEHQTLIGVSVVSLCGHAILIEGPPGSGKSSLALALIDRGAKLIGDDGVVLAREGGLVFASPPPEIAGKFEIRGVGIVQMDAESAPLALILSIDDEPQRFPGSIASREILGLSIPRLPFRPGDAIQALRAEWALRTHGLTF